MNATPVGALLLCRADPETVRPLAHLLRERMLLIPAGEEWSVLVPEGRAWRDTPAEPAEPVDRVVAGWAAALGVASTWPAVALWWDGTRAGCVLASGFRRPVGYVWLADGTPAGEDEAMTTFAARLDLDPVLDVQALQTLTRPDPHADGYARLRTLLGLLTRTGVELRPGLEPGRSTEELRDAARELPGTGRIEWAGWRDAVRVELDAVESSGLGPWMLGPRARAVATTQVLVGAPLALWGAFRRSGGWTAAGALLLAQGVLGLAYNEVRAGAVAREAPPHR
ncbi:hypothetical protein [Streptomyces sp. NBC_00102]|uniref:hypothetical protein n=1 Tax=Streptomyces sp. NBC_00102 TaxID=2975652 RepID=UPI0022550C95|nr:hypothetical protein [Streptomyces sp. NBC_00102]MCX5399699.1 hypothetical protein [Streptomyces sp. NBC_00102]